MTTKCKHNVYIQNCDRCKNKGKTKYKLNYDLIYGKPKSNIENFDDGLTQIYKFNLSEREWEDILPSGLREAIYYKADVKEFIRILKEEINDEDWFKKEDIACIYAIIDKLCGDKLK